MKSIKYLFISIIVLFSVQEADACWDQEYELDYDMYSVINEQSEIYLYNYDYKSTFSKLNCEEWQQLTSPEIPYDDVYKVVYVMSLDDFNQVYTEREKTYDNEFLEWITKKDTDILEYLKLAKVNENMRNKLNSRWYYPSMKCESEMMLDEIAEKAMTMAAQKPRLSDRYHLQALRAYFSMGQFDECLELWKKEGVKIPDGKVMKKMMMSYVIGIEVRKGETGNLEEYCTEMLDFLTFRMWTHKFDSKYKDKFMSQLDFIEIALKNHPESENVFPVIQCIINGLEESYKINHDNEKEMLNDLYALSKKQVNRTKGIVRAKWLYTCAELCRIKENYSQASAWLSKAETYKVPEYLEKSFMVMRVYLDSKTCPYSAAYEKKLFNKIKWLDSKNADDDLSFLIVNELVPKLEKNNKHIRAMQLYNYMRGYRSYNNHFFEKIDSMGAETAEKYVLNVRNSKNEFDRFLNDRSYTDADYLNDIVGTLYLRSMNYKKAMEYLGAVSESYKDSLHVKLECDPFEIDKTHKYYDNYFKYEFAREMYSLEESIKITSNPDRKAQLMFKMAVGLRNSFYECWPLVHYYMGIGYDYSVTNKRLWAIDKYTKAALARAEKIFEEACSIAGDDVAASLHYKLKHFRTVATNYPETNEGKIVRGQCDTYKDYNVMDTDNWNNWHAYYVTEEIYK